MTEYAFEGAKRSTTTITWSFAAETYPNDAAIPYSNPIADLYRSTIEAAFARWAAVAGVTFVESADAPNDAIRIGFGAFGNSSTVGQTYVRASNGILNQDTVVRLLDPNILPLSLSQSGAWAYTGYGITLFQVAVHEIGHALGLDHTTDPVTLMYPIASLANADLAPGDIYGLNALYPLYTVAALNPVQIEPAQGSLDYRFTVTRSSEPATALTVTYTIAGATYPSLPGTVAATGAAFAGGAMPSGQVTFAAGSRTATVDIVVPANATPSPDQGFSLTLASTDPTVSATTRGSNTAVILDDNGYAQVSNGALGIYRFFDLANGTHFFTASQAERNGLMLGRTDLSYEGVDLTAVDNPAADPAAVPVYRFFDTTFGTHFYTAVAAERDSIAASRTDLTYEGVAFYEDATASASTGAVYRYFDSTNGTHFYTSSATERASIDAHRADLIGEGIAFYAPLG